MKKNLIKKMFLISLLGILSAGCSQPKDETEKKIDDLLSQMTLSEKIGQMNQLNGGRPIDDLRKAVKEGNLGSILNTSHT